MTAAGSAYRSTLSGCICTLLILLVASGISIDSLGQELGRPLSRKDVLRTLNDYIDKNINFVLFAKSDGRGDEEILAAAKSDKAAFKEKADILVAMYKEAVGLLSGKEYTREFVEKLEQDTGEMMLKSKRLILLKKDRLLQEKKRFLNVR